MLGNFLGRDGLGYIDGLDLYTAYRSSPASLRDALGTDSTHQCDHDPAQHFSNEEHHNFQTFTCRCPSGTKIKTSPGSVKVGYAGMIGCLIAKYLARVGVVGHDLSNLPKGWLDSIRDEYDAIETLSSPGFGDPIYNEHGTAVVVDNNNCTGDAAHIGVSMRTRLVADTEGGIGTLRWRTLHKFNTTEEFRACYKAETVVNFECVPCAGAPTAQGGCP